MKSKGEVWTLWLGWALPPVCGHVRALAGVDQSLVGVCARAQLILKVKWIPDRSTASPLADGEVRQSRSVLWVGGLPDTFMQGQPEEVEKTILDMCEAFGVTHAITIRSKIEQGTNASWALVRFWVEARGSRRAGPPPDAPVLLLCDTTRACLACARGCAGCRSPLPMSRPCCERSTPASKSGRPS